MAEVLYRKWRPRRLEQVVGQEAVTQTLRNAVSLGRIAHAYLFTGPRGTGKTSTARIMAKAANCREPQGGEPDDTCDICQSINEGRSLDLIEIDAASNRGIDDIRDLRDKVGYTPPRGPVQGLHHRRGPHAHRAGLQRAVEDPRGAARPRDLHPRDDRNPQGAAHDHLPVPAVRLPADIPRHHPNAARHPRPEGRPHGRAGGAGTAGAVVIGEPARCGKPAGTGAGVVRIAPPRGASAQPA